MKNIACFTPPKYHTAGYRKVATNVYKSENYYVTSISFQQEPALGEGSSAAEISQYPLEDLLERFFVHVSDFYPSLNQKTSSTCYVEFASSKVDHIQRLLSIIGKRVYNKAYCENGEEYIELVIE